VRGGIRPGGGSRARGERHEELHFFEREEIRRRTAEGAGRSPYHWRQKGLQGGAIGDIDGNTGKP
jgi:hypothetical protein